MGAIYRLAAHTCIWLGEAADESDLAMDLIGQLDAVNFENTTNYLSQDGVRAMKRLQERGWWSRGWVIQGSEHPRILFLRQV